jgi:beta-galactosidase
LISLNGEWQFSSNDPALNKTIQVPFCYDFRGKATCSRTFNLDNVADFKAHNYILVCDGINYQCEININGKFIIKHEGGYNGFSSLILEGILTQSENKIEIKIDNTLDLAKTLPLSSNTFLSKNYGGIYRDIYILTVPKLFIKSFKPDTEIDINYNADITGIIQITSTDLNYLSGSSGDDKFTVKTEIIDTSGTLKASSNPAEFNAVPNSTIQVKNHFTFSNPQFWSPDDPELYTIRVVISKGQNIIDVYNADYGVYELARRPGSILFNRGELKLKGLSYVEEFPAKGTAGTYAEVENDVRNIKLLGCNAIILPGHSASPYLIYLCNRYGLFILEEIPVHTVPPKILGKDNLAALAENLLSEMIALHKNNPSVLGYGLGTNLDYTDEITKSFITKLIEEAKSADKKLIYYTARPQKDNIYYEEADMVGLNYYDTDSKILKEYLTEPRIKKQRLFISSYGKNINPADYSGYSDPYSVESQSKFIVDYGKILKSSQLIGGFFLTFSDWNADSPNLQCFDKTNRFFKTTGILGFNRDLRTSANIYKKVNFEEDIPNLNIGSYTKESPLIFVIIGLFTFILFVYLANSVRRFRDNVWRALFRPFIFFTDIRDQSLIGGFYNILLAFILSIGGGLFFANLLYFLKESPDLNFMLSVLFNSDNIKLFISGIIANPIKLTLFMSAVIFLKVFIIAFVIWLFSLTLKFKVGFNNSYTVAVWGMLPSLILLIIGSFYIRILHESPDFAVIGLILAFILYLLSLYRIIKGTYIIFDTFFLKAYTWGIVTIAIVCGSFWIIVNSTRYFSDYLGLILTFIKN